LSRIAGTGYGADDDVEFIADDVQIAGSDIYNDFFDSLFFIIGVLMLMKFFQGVRESSMDNTLSEEEETEKRRTRMDKISTRLNFTTIQKEEDSSIEIASGSVDLDTVPTNEPTKTQNTDDSGLEKNETNEKDPVAEPEDHNQDDLEGPKNSCSECNQTKNDNASNQLVSAVSSFFTSMRSIGGGQQQQQEECCSICLEPYKEGDIVATLKPCFGSCQHKFHKDCLLEWLQDHDECPLCRINMTGVIARRDSERLFYP
jgi:hypothetical protein